MALTASLVGRGTTGGSSVTTAAGTSSASATFAVLVSYDSTAGTITTATDNKGNTYTAVGTPQADSFGGLMRWYVCENGTGGAGHTFTFTTASPCYAVAHLLQITGTGIPRRDIAAQGQDTAGQPWDTVATGTLGYTNEVILAACASQVGSAAYTSANTTILSSEGDTASFWTSGVGSAALATTASFTPSFARADGGGSTAAGLSHITFREEVSGNGNAAGVTLTATASLVPGAATGQQNGTAAGATLTATATLVPGAASGQANATASGATLTATASLIAGVARQLPELGAYTYIGQEEGSGTNPATTSAITTQTAGSSFFTLRAGYATNNTAPTDSKSNAWQHMGGSAYLGWSGLFDAQVYVAQNGTGGSGHTLSFAKPAQPASEITASLIEILGAQQLVGFSLVNIGVGNALQSGSVTTTGPALLIAVWLGDAAGLNHTASPNNSFSNFISFGTLPPNSAVQMFVASRQVTAAGTYSVTWTESPDQGAILVLAAFGADGPNGYATGATLTATASLVPGAATGGAGAGATASGATLTAVASVVPGQATGGATAAGAALSATSSLLPGVARGGAQASGQMLTATASIVPGAATGNATASGAALAAVASLVPGSAQGGASAAGQTIQAVATMVTGAAAGGATASGQALTAVASLVPGAASSTPSGSVTASGAVLQSSVQLIAGAAIGGALASGRTLQATASLSPGSATGSGPTSTQPRTSWRRAPGSQRRPQTPTARRNGTPTD